MAFLFFNAHSMSVSEALSGIGEYKGVVVNTLKQDGFTDVINTSTEIAGDRNGVRVSILHLPIAGRKFWQVFMAGGDGNNTQTTLNEVVKKIEHLKFL
ncbi:MAG: hypothetical protein ABW213_15770 [Tardiphaga sp.]